MFDRSGNGYLPSHPSRTFTWSAVAPGNSSIEYWSAAGGSSFTVIRVEAIAVDSRNPTTSVAELLNEIRS
jgi:hypothetical protein